MKFRKSTTECLNHILEPYEQAGKELQALPGLVLHKPYHTN